MTTVYLEIYLPFRGQRIWRGEEQVPSGLLAGDLPAYLGLGHVPELVVIVNGRAGVDGQPLQPGESVAILRQVEGGEAR